MASEEFERQKAENKKNWGSMTMGQKLQFFLDYYALRVFAAAVGLIMVIYLLITVFGPHTEYMVQAAVFDQLLNEEAEAALTENLEEVLGISEDKYKTVLFMDNMSSTVTTDVTKFDTYMYNKQVDVTICGREQYEVLANQGMLLELTEIFDDDFSEYEELMLLTAGYLDEDSDDVEYDGTGLGEEKYYGVSLKMSAAWNDSIEGTNIDEPIACVIRNTEHTEEVHTFLTYFLNN